jgi:hypothetical protein
MKGIRTIFMSTALVIIAGFLLIQLLPYGRNHANPPIIHEPNWDSAQTERMVQQACADCHSNETVWPWYTNVAPVSWLVQKDVIEGRKKLNFSQWGLGGEGEEVEELAEVIREGKMPPASYLMLHPDARLSDAEKQQLVQGLIISTGGINQESENEAEEH